MLKLLTLQDFALVRELRLDLEEGLCLLTGETGAGKSILVEAVGLLAGRRAESHMVREGAQEAVIEGRFEPKRHGKAVAALCERWSIPYDKSLSVRRRVLREGRNAVTVNGKAIPLVQLKDLGKLLVDIHGQHQGQDLLNEDLHLAVIDSLPRVAPLALETSEAFLRLREALADLRTAKRTKAERSDRLSFLKAQREDIDGVNPAPGEDESLLTSRNRLQGAEKIALAAGGVSHILRNGEPSVSLMLAQVGSHLETLADIDPQWRPYLHDLHTSTAVLATIASEAEREAATVSFDPSTLEEVLQRLADFDRLKSRFGPTLEDVLSHRRAIGEEIESLEGGAVSEEEARARVEARFSEYMARASSLSKARKEAAGRLEGAVQEALRPLALEKARFVVSFVPRPVREPEEASPEGLERASFYLSANPGESPKPLAKIASGGELSRTLLALLTAADPASAPDTLVFDEVDAGIGGMPAERVGLRLRQLASKHQVLCITHLPQIAAFAHWHATVRKRQEAGRTLISTAVLDDPSCVAELARMLAGEEVSETAVAHAKTLLDSARSSA